MIEFTNNEEPRLPHVPPARPSWDASAFVWGIWALGLLIALTFIWQYGRNIPICDDWEMVPALTGDQPITLTWLWDTQWHGNEHRIPLAKIVILVLHKLTGGDFRSGMYAYALSMGTLAFAMIRVARSLRGWTSYSDAFFPLVLLNLGHAQNLLNDSQIIYALVVVTAGALLLVIVRRGDRLTLGAAVVAGICLILLSLNGAYGLGFVPFLALWLGCWGALQWRTPDKSEKRGALLMLALASAALLLCCLYFLGIRRQHNEHSSPGLGATLRIAVQFLAQGIGPTCRVFWPQTGCLVVGLLLLSAGSLVMAVWRHRSRECLRALGLLIFLIDFAGLALAVGWGRAGADPYSYGLYAERYVAFSALALCCVYFIWEIYSPPAVSRLAQMSLFTLICLAVPINTMLARNEGRERKYFLEAFKNDLRSGVPAPTLARRYETEIFHVSIPEKFRIECLQMLHREKIGAFRDLQ